MEPSASQTNHVVLAGGSGFLGQALLPILLERFSSVTILSRGEPRIMDRVRYISWDGRTVGAWAKALDNAGAIINFTGKSVDCRKTARNRRIILESRVDSVRALAAAWRQVAHPPMRWIQSGTAHIHGDTASETIADDSPTGVGFAPDVGRAWEAALNDESLPGVRKVILRTSFVLGREGGALPTLAGLARWFLGGTVGTGEQYISWIHIHDFNRIIARMLDDASMSGPYLVTAPHPVTNRDFMIELRHALNRPWSPPAPAFGVRIASFFMRTDPELALLGRRCVPTRLLQEGFKFDFPEIPRALQNLLRKARN